jgi:predicted O-methyltransferase YrrM
LKKLAKVIIQGLLSLLPVHILIIIAKFFGERDINILIQAIGPYFSKKEMDDFTFDFEIEGKMEFEHLMGLFSSTVLDSAIIVMSVREAAYLFHLIRSTKAQKVVEIGTFKGGSTIFMAAAMEGKGDLWSLDLGEKETRFRKEDGRPYPKQIADFCDKNQLGNVKLLVGDSRSFEIDTSEVDIVFIDGGHSYEMVKNDFERFGRKVRVGGSILFHDVYSSIENPSPSDDVGRVVKEICNMEDDFALEKVVQSLAHVVRIK